MALHRWLVQVGCVLESLNQGVIINDSDRRIVFANSMFLEMIQTSSENLLGRNVADLFPPEDVPRLIEHIAHREETGRAQFEFYIPQAGGGRLPVAVTSKLVKSSDGQPFGIVTATDISEQKRIELELRSANAQLLDRQRQIELELQLAERVQQSLAPRTLAWEGISVETHYQAAWSIGGDFGLIAPKKEYLDVLLCDVSGHGISSALVANRIYSEVLTQIERPEGLDAILGNLNQFVLKTLGSSSFYFTVAAIRLNHHRRSLQFIGTGHPPAIIIRQGSSPRLVESRNKVLGLFDDALEQEPGTEVELNLGDRVLIYTDGLTEAFNFQGEMLGIEGLAEIAKDTGNLPLSEMKQQILNRVAEWRSGPADDDVSFVLLEIGPFQKQSAESAASRR